MFSLHIDTARTWRGGQNQVLLTVNGLRAAGHRAALVAHPNGELRARASEGLELIPLAPRTEMDLAAAWQLGRVIRRERPDILHAHDPHGVAFASLAISLIGGRTRQPPLVASRRVDFLLKTNAFSRWKYRQVQMFLCASEAIRHLLLGQGVEAHRTVTIHEAVDVEHVAAAPFLDARAEFWLPHGCHVVGAIGALVAHKGHRYLVDAAALVVRQRPDTYFLILGAGELESALERQIRAEGLEKHVRLTGFRADVLSLLKSFDVFVMSSVTEGLGTSILDAMAAARPVVASRIGGIPEVVDDGRTGVLVPPRDARALADAIVRLLDAADLRQQMGEAGLARVRDRFTVERMIDETSRVYDRVVGTTP